MTKLTLPSWSFSSLMVFETCPYRTKLERLDKVPDNTPRPAADRGTQIHQEAEDYVTGKGQLTHNLRHFNDDLAALNTHRAASRVVCEEEWGFDRNWEVAPWRTAWLRLKCDVVCQLTNDHIAVIDFKTGKRFGNELKHAQQLQLYALCTLLRYPQVEKTTNELWYVDQNELADFEMRRSQLSRYLKVFDKRARKMTECTDFTPNPNAHSCRWCPYAPHKQGNCPHGVNPDEVKTRGGQPLTFSAPKNRRPSAVDKLFEKD